MNYVTKLKYDEKPDYEKCRKCFMDGLKSLGKSNSGDLEFKSASTPGAKKAVAVASPAKEQRPKGRPSAKVAVKKNPENTENISPKVKVSRKRDTENHSSEDSESPLKKPRTKLTASKSTTQRTSKVSTKASTIDSSIVVNNHVKEEKVKKNKTYNVNIDLDISFDANVVVNVKRKPKKPKDIEPESPSQTLQSTDEIPPSDKSFIVSKTTVYKRAHRSSPRNK